MGRWQRQGGGGSLFGHGCWHRVRLPLLAARASPSAFARALPGSLVASGRAPLLACRASTADLVASGRSAVCRARACRTRETRHRPGLATWRARSGRPVGHAACVPCLRKPSTQVRGSRCHREYAGFSHRHRGHNGRRAWPRAACV